MRTARSSFKIPWNNQPGTYTPKGTHSETSQKSLTNQAIKPIRTLSTKSLINLKNSSVYVDKRDLIHIRDSEPEDYNFMMATWLRGLYYGNDWFNRIDKDIFMDNYHKIIDFLIVKPSIQTRVACLKEDPSVILGYSVSEATTLHWVFVKRAWRNIGIAHDLVPKDIQTVTHLTNAWIKTDYTFNPFIT